MIRSPARTLPERFTILSIALFTASIARLWLLPLSSSLWVDELVTTFVLRFPHHYSFAVAPQVPDSLYYWLPRLSWTLFGHSETALRLPSIFAMALALVFISRIAIRIIHPRAGWLAVFLCLALSGIDYFAVDARPYAFGIAVASASILFLIRWLDGGHWIDEAVFLACAAVLWRIHLLYWPFYLVYAVYAAARLRKRDTVATGTQILTAAVFIPVALFPVARTALGRLAGAQSHVFNPPPPVLEFVYKAHFNVVLICLAVAWLLHRLAKGEPSSAVSGPSWILVASWWLACPVCLFFYSHYSGNGVFIPRYLSLMLPGIALTATAVAARFLRDDAWGPSAIAVGIVGLFLMGQWLNPRPWHDTDDWRAAAAAERRLADDRTPVLCASPFIEAQPPVWTPDYPLPGFLYSHLTYYPVRGKVKLFPFTQSAESNGYARKLLNSELVPAAKFIVYGPRGGSNYLVKYLTSLPELAAWHTRTMSFGNVTVTTFEAGRSDFKT
jgi:Dolichyl-phosphate-mannose-protein mannosyltransferase